MNANAKAMLLASFTGDALSLGVHWIYNTNVIDKKYGRVTDMLAPRLASFHRGKTEGDFTHYGDQALLLLESAASGNGFDLNRFSDDWRGFFVEYEGYIDKATQAVQANFKAGKHAGAAGSFSRRSRQAHPGNRTSLPRSPFARETPPGTTGRPTPPASLPCHPVQWHQPLRRLLQAYRGQYY